MESTGEQPSSPENAAQKPKKTMAEHRQEFYQKYDSGNEGFQRRPRFDTEWVDENGGEKINRVYLFSGGSDNKGADDLTEFYLKARHAGFQILLDVPKFMPGKNQTPAHQLVLEGNRTPRSIQVPIQGQPQIR